MLSFWNSISEKLVILIPLIVGLLVAHQTYAHYIRSRVFSYIERFNSRDFMDLRINADQWLAKNHSPDKMDKLSHSTNHEEISINIKLKTFLNLFQELAVCYERRLIDRKVFYNNFDFLIINYWGKFEDFIMYTRAQTGDYTLYKRFEKMAKDVKNHRVKKDNHSRLFVFGYGSLMVPESIHNTLKRKDNHYTTTTATLKEYERKWNIKVPVVLEEESRLVDAVFLNIVKNVTATTNGILLEINQHELELLKAREINYDCIEVTNKIESSILKENDVVVTFVGQQEHLLNSTDTGVILENYLKILNKLDQYYDEQFIQEYHRTTSPSESPVVKGNYRFN